MPVIVERDGIRLEWICNRPNPDKCPGRAEACESICIKAAKLNKWTVVGIRHIDHRTTRITPRRGGPHHGPVTVPADPHITVYVGDTSPIKQHYKGGGHFYIVYGHDLPRLPDRLARDSEVSSGVNPEIWDRQNNLFRTYNH